MGGKRINNKIIIVFIIVSILLVLIDFALQFTDDKESEGRNSEMISKPEKNADSTRNIEEEIQLPVDFRE